MSIHRKLGRRYQLSEDCKTRVMSSHRSLCQYRQLRLVAHQPYSCTIDTSPFAPSRLLIEHLSRKKATQKMQYTLQSGNGTAVARHKYATVLLEQQLIAISKQAHPARHESFTTAARQTQFGSCDTVPQLYLPAPQIEIDRRRSKIDVICYDIK